MLHPATVEKVEALLADGLLSHRKVAKLTGISRGSVGAIANGKRRPIAAPLEGSDQDGPLVRCEECGAMVYLPCGGCRTRRLVARGHLPRRPDRPGESPALESDLDGEPFERYRQIRALHAIQKRNTTRLARIRHGGRGSVS